MSLLRNITAEKTTLDFAALDFVVGCDGFGVPIRYLSVELVEVGMGKRADALRYVP